MNSTKYIKYEKDGNVGIVTMSKPAHNLIDGVMMEELVQVYAHAESDGCRALILRSDMRHFCAGADLNYFSPTTIQADRAAWDSFMGALEDISIPTVAAVGGGALGGGLELALTCDMVIAANTAFLGQVEVIAGLIPLLGGTQRLAQRVGVARAKEIAMFGRRHDPVTLERWGAINLVVAEAELMTAAKSWARQLAAGPTIALKAIKIQANLAAREGVAAADRRQIELNEMVWHAKDRVRAFEAFDKTGPGTAVYLGD
jgi:enoyl-CoA hydratase/carnithine racemase